MICQHGFRGFLRFAVGPAALAWRRILRTGRVALASGVCLYSVAALAQAPQLVSVSPARGATGVAVNEPLVFTFDRDMNTSIPLVPSLPGIFVGNIEFDPPGVAFVDGVWSENKRVLTCTPSGDWPPNTTITWRLNPVGSLFPLTSATGTPLGMVSGQFTTGAGGGGGGNTPELVAVVPAIGAVGVPVTTTVTFVFDRPMKKTTPVAGAIQWQGNGLDPARFSYSWSADGQNLVADYDGDLPAMTMIAWRLNPPGATTRLESAEGVPLPSDTFNGMFTTGNTGGGGGGCDPDGIPDAWGGYNFGKSGAFVQTSTADPVPVAEEPFTFGAMVKSPQAGPVITAASVTLPGGAKKNLSAAPFGGFLFFSDTPASEAALDAAYPGGNYTLRFTPSGQAERVITMNLPAAWPPVPKVANYTEAQSVNPKQDFTLRWNAFTGASAQDYISLVVSSTNFSGSTVVFEAPDLCVPRELPVTATSIVIPANTLQPNQTYQATLTFARIGYFSTNAVPQMAGLAYVVRSTDFTLRTGAGTVTGVPARFIGYRRLPNGNPELTFTGTPAHPYTLQRATSLTARDWVNVGTVTTDATGRGVFEDAQPGKQPPLFYRALTN
jgi:hypothetical protein